MNVELIGIDSAVIGHNLIEIKNFSITENFPSFEKIYCSLYNPICVVCKIPIEDIKSVHFLESYGFNIIEVQARLTLILKKEYDTLRYNFTLIEVDNNNDLEEALNIAGTTFTDDRYSIDPYLNSIAMKNISGERYRRYTLKSFQMIDERLYVLKRSNNNEVLALGTHQIFNEKEALLFNLGVKNSYKNMGIGVIFEYFRLNQLRKDGIKKVITHISLRNYQSLNIAMNLMRFKIKNNFIVLNKYYF